MSVSSRFPPEVTAWMERWRLLRDGELLTTHSRAAALQRPSAELLQRDLKAFRGTLG